ncbi:lactonase family protein [Paenibacillus sp. GCM10012307]|uniref:Lactonase family protein n=1 Tax=Paenibacillus roseus TaxID=2798579 RepID=A0A934J506_9BACL|nr:lactonase family protein [Paenibacillus roseus]MBJ6360545.1 lactonase family protein [Paenibacillus roseus]
MTIYAYIGSYASASGPGLLAASYDPATGKLELLQEVSGLSNPTFLDVNADDFRLYALFDVKDAEGNRTGGAAAYTIDRSNGKLALINEATTTPAPTCHLVLDETNSFIIVASYHGGLIGVSELLEDGGVGSSSDLKQHHGSSVHPAQTQARAHSVFIAPGNRYAVACDLGLDKLFVYSLDAGAGKLTLKSETSVAPGSGPRHFVFHPSQPYGYAINELNSTVTAFHYDNEEGKLTELQTLSTLPEDFAGESYCADIHISPDGKFVYGSNRGHDSIVVYAVDQASGKLNVVEYTSTLGGHPRNFGLSPDGRFLLVANRDGNNIVTFRRDEQSGKLEATGDQLAASKPVCIKFLEVR